MSTVVYRYRIAPMGTVAHRRSVLDQPDLLEQFRLAHDMRSDLVLIEQDYDAAKAAMWSSYPSVGETEAELADAELQMTLLLERARKERSEDRTKKLRPDTAAAHRDAKQRVTAARKARREAISAVHEAAAEDLERILTARAAAQKALYATYVQERGLYWATYNAVLKSHRTAAQRVAAARAAGRPAQMRIHHWDTTGRIAVQLQRAAGAPPRTPNVIADPAGKYRNVLQIRTAPGADPAAWPTYTRAEQRQLGRGELVWCIGNGRTITLPVQMHRPIPTDHEIVAAELARTRIGPTVRMHVCLTVKGPDPLPPTTRTTTVAVHLGWRSTDIDGHPGIRVATWRSTTPLQVPEHLPVIDGTGTTGRIIIPTRWIEAADKTADLAEIRAQHLNTLRGELVTWLNDNPQDDEHEGLTGQAVALWRSPARFAALARRWRTNPPTGDSATDIVHRLEEWRKKDAHLWIWQETGRDQNLGRRDDTWQAVAAWLWTNADHIVVDDANLAELRKKPAIGSDEETTIPTAAANRARAQATLAAPGRLRELITAAAQLHGIPVTVVKSKNLTRECARCGHITDHDDVTEPKIQCGGCGHTTDQDDNATALMITRAASAPTE